MTYQEREPINLTELSSLALTLDLLLNKTEKHWGYFQVQKEADFYSLVIPSLPSFRLYANPKSIGYKGYWRDRQDIELPNLKDKHDKPDLYTTRKTRQVEISRPAEVAKQVEVIKQSRKSSSTPQSKVLKRQVTFAINYRYHSCPEIRRLNQIIANLMRDRIAESVTFSPAEEIMPLVLITEIE